MSEPRQLPAVIQTNLAAWKRMAYAWESLHYASGVAALLLLPLTHVMSEEGQAWGKSPLLHVASAANVVFVALVTFLQPRTKARGYWDAYYHLHAACLHFLGHHRASEEKLWDVWVEAERSFLNTEQQDQLQDLMPSATVVKPSPAGRHEIAPENANGHCVCTSPGSANGYASAPEANLAPK
jgi:hypothetical protein